MKGSNRLHKIDLEIKKNEEKLQKACEKRGFKFSIDPRLGNAH
jgi:hypothetical protein